MHEGVNHINQILVKLKSAITSFIRGSVKEPEGKIFQFPFYILQILDTEKVKRLSFSYLGPIQQI